MEQSQLLWDCPGQNPPVGNRLFERAGTVSFQPGADLKTLQYILAVINKETQVFKCGVIF